MGGRGRRRLRAGPARRGGRLTTGLSRRAFAGLLLAGAAPAPPPGNVTLLHLADLHAQLRPLPVEGPGGRWRRLGGVDRIATLVAEARAERPGRTLLLDGGDALQGSWPSLRTRGADAARLLRALGIEATTGHWEFTYGEGRVAELPAELGCPFLAGNVADAEWDEPVLPHTALFERGGVLVAVIGQAYPHTAVANPRRLFPGWTFGLRERLLHERVRSARASGAGLVVLLSHDGLDLDLRLAERVGGLDVILTAHTHEALAEPRVVGRTLVAASGCNGAFLTRLDLDVGRDGVRAWSHRLIPVDADAILPDPAVARLAADLRAPFEPDLARVIGRADHALCRRDPLAGTWDAVICAALLEQADAEVALSPGFRWGTCLLPGGPITMEEVWAQTAITYPETYRRTMTGAELKAALEDVADNAFNPDPLYRQGGDMVRTGGLRFTLDPAAPAGRRVAGLALLRTGEPVEPGRSYAVAGWAAVGDAPAEGPPVWELVERHIAARGVIRPTPPAVVRP